MNLELIAKYSNSTDGLEAIINKNGETYRVMLTDMDSGNIFETRITTERKKAFEIANQFTFGVRP